MPTGVCLFRASHIKGGREVGLLRPSASSRRTRAGYELYKTNVGVIPGRCPARQNRGMRILVVEDDRAVREALRRALTLAGYEVQSAEDGEQAIEMVVQNVPDAVVLDIGLPGIDGLEVCRRLRLLGNRVAILILTARDVVSDRIDGLDAGADDYLVKPFDVNELKARLRALLRRTGSGDDPDSLSFAEIRLDSARHGAEVDGHFTELTRTEYQLLELLMLNPRRVLPHSLIYDRVWGYDFGPASNALRVYVGYLRRKLEHAGARPLIHTVRGVGYVMREP
jgi:two-component system response regulator MprA